MAKPQKTQEQSEVSERIVVGLECQLKTVYGIYKNVRVTELGRPLTVAGSKYPKVLSFYATHDKAQIRAERISMSDVEEVLPVDWQPKQESKKEVYDDGLEWW